jgi:hypothetical protein
MCVFCAAIPATLAIGAKAKSKQRQEAELAKVEGKTLPRKIIPVGTSTAVAVTGLAVCSIIYHTHLNIPI